VRHYYVIRMAQEYFVREGIIRRRRMPIGGGLIGPYPWCVIDSVYERVGVWNAWHQPMAIRTPFYDVVLFPDHRF
jgi:hypothetical protein